MKKTIVVFVTVLLSVASGALATDILGRIEFIVPKPISFVRNAIQTGEVKNVLLNSGLHNALQEKYPVETSGSADEVWVYVYVKVAGQKVYVFRILISRATGQSWEQAIDGTDMSSVNSSNSGSGSSGSGAPPGGWPSSPIYWQGVWSGAYGGPTGVVTCEPACTNNANQ